MFFKQIVMKNKNLVNDIKFWVDQNIIHCSIPNGFEEHSLEEDIEALFFNAISTLSKDRYMPILIDIQAVNFLLSVKLFKFLSNNALLNTAVLSKTFLVNSFVLKVFLSLYNFSNDPIVPNAIFNNDSAAITYCDHKIMVFNALS